MSIREKLLARNRTIISGAIEPLKSTNENRISVATQHALKPKSDFVSSMNDRLWSSTQDDPFADAESLSGLPKNIDSPNEHLQHTLQHQQNGDRFNQNAGRMTSDENHLKTDTKERLQALQDVTIENSTVIQQSISKNQVIYNDTDADSTFQSYPYEIPVTRNVESAEPDNKQAGLIDSHHVAMQQSISETPKFESADKSVRSQTSRLNTNNEKNKSNEAIQQEIVKGKPRVKSESTQKKSKAQRERNQSRKSNLTQKSLPPLKPQQSDSKATEFAIKARAKKHTQIHIGSIQVEVIEANKTQNSGKQTVTHAVKSANRRKSSSSIGKSISSFGLGQL